MDLIIFSIVILIIFGGSMTFLYLMFDKLEKKNKDTLREIVIALKSKGVQEYVDVLPNDGDLPKQEEEEYIDIDQVESKELLNSLKQ